MVCAARQVPPCGLPAAATGTVFRHEFSAYNVWVREGQHPWGNYKVSAKGLQVVTDEISQKHKHSTIATKYFAASAHVLLNINSLRAVAPSGISSSYASSFSGSRYTFKETTLYIIITEIHVKIWKGKQRRKNR